MPETTNEVADEQVSQEDNPALTFSKAPSYFEMSSEEQEAMKDNAFALQFGNTEEYKNASDVGKKAMHTEFIRAMDHESIMSPNNPYNQEAAKARQEIDNAGWVENIFIKGKHSLETAVTGATLIDNAMRSGPAAANLGEQITQFHKKVNEQAFSREEKVVAINVDTMLKKMEKSGFVGDLEAAGTFLKQVLTDPDNIKGFIHLGAESFSSIAAGYLGGKAAAGTAVGVAAITGGTATPLVPVITAIGSVTGMAADAVTHKLYEEISEKLQTRGLDITPFNVNKWAEENPEELEAARTDSLIYAGTMGIADTALNKVITKFEMIPKIAAKAKAAKMFDTLDRTTVRVLADKSGTTIKGLSDQFIAHNTEKLLQQRSLISKGKNIFGQYLGEVASEPISEAIATAAAGDENTAENLIYETIGGVGGGPIGTAANISLYGSKNVASKTGEKISDAVVGASPDVKADLKRIKAEKKLAKKQAKADRAAGYKKDVETLQPTDDISNISDPESEEFNSLKAAEVLSKSSDPKHLDQVYKLAEHALGKVETTEKQIADLEAKIKENPDKPMRAEKLQIKKLQELMVDQGVLVNKIIDHAETLERNVAQAADNVEVEPITDAEAASIQQIEDNILKTFGSSGNKQLDTETLEKLSKRTDLPDDTRESVASTLKAVKAEGKVKEQIKKINKQPGKSSIEVHSDVFNGSKEKVGRRGFIGINDYKKRIRAAVKDNDSATATKEIAKLKKWADSHAEKAAIYRAVFDFKSTPDSPLTPEQEAKYAEMRKADPDLDIHIGSGEFVTLIELESQAINATLDNAIRYVNLGGRVGGRVAQRSSKEGANTGPETASPESATAGLKQPTSKWDLNKIYSEAKKRYLGGAKNFDERDVELFEFIENNEHLTAPQKKYIDAQLKKVREARVFKEGVEKAKKSRKETPVKTTPTKNSHESTLGNIKTSTNKENLQKALQQRNEAIISGNLTEEELVNYTEQRSAIETRLRELNRPIEDVPMRTSESKPEPKQKAPEKTTTEEASTSVDASEEQPAETPTQAEPQPITDESFDSLLEQLENERIDEDEDEDVKEDMEPEPEPDTVEEAEPEAAPENETASIEKDLEEIIDSFNLTPEQLGKIKIDYITAEGDLAHGTYDEAVAGLNKQKKMFEELRKCITS